MVLLNLMETRSFSIKTNLPVPEDLKLLDSQHHLTTLESVMVSAYSLTQLLCNIFSLLHNDLYVFMYSYVDASYGWKKVIQLHHRVYLLENLCIKKIANQLLQGMDGTQLITDDIYQRINHAVTKKDANEIFLEHLGSKTLSGFDIFCKILRQTSKDYEVHEEVADRLEGDIRIWVGPYTSEYG